jgi:integrase
MPLTEVACKNSKPSSKTKRITDERGLYLEIAPNGGKYWRFKYRFGAKEKRLAIGVYPEVTLKVAREKRDEARMALREGVDPSAEKKAARLQRATDGTNSFRAIAEEWHQKQADLWTPRHAAYVLRRLELDVFGELGSFPIKTITGPILLAVIRKIEARNAIDLSHRVLQTIGQILRYAIATGRAERDITSDLRGSLKPQRKVSHTCLDERDLPEFLQKLQGYDGDLQTKIALRLLILTFVRTIELRGAKWEEVNFEKAEWRIPAERMKMRETHIVPLSTQAIALFREQKRISGNRDHIFPNRNKPAAFMSENTMLYAIYRLGYHSRTTGHGFRATASTILNERGFKSDVIERQLAHGERNRVRASYNRAQYLNERREMMQWWSDFLEGQLSAPKDGAWPGRAGSYRNGLVTGSPEAVGQIDRGRVRTSRGRSLVQSDAVGPPIVNLFQS